MKPFNSLFSEQSALGEPNICKNLTTLDRIILCVILRISAVLSHKKGPIIS